MALSGFLSRLSLPGKQNGVNHVDDAVGRGDIGERFEIASFDGNIDNCAACSGLFNCCVVVTASAASAAYQSVILKFARV